jgi:excisionase family DNA binding protein
MNTKDIMTINEVAELLGFTPFTIRRWIKKGLIKGIQVNPHGKWMIMKEEVDKLLKEDI